MSKAKDRVPRREPPSREPAPWRPEGAPAIEANVQRRSCGDPDCPRCRRNRWVRRLTGGLAGYGG